jgi:hypothetical protein
VRKGLDGSKAYNNFKRHPLNSRPCMKYFFLLLILTRGVIPAAAQEEFIDPARPLTKFNFIQLYGGVIMIRAQLMPFPDSLNFIFDTGSGGISLDSITVQDLGLNPTPTSRTIRGVGGIKRVAFLYNQQLNFPGLLVENLDFHINDYDILTSIYGFKIDGIIGYSVINRFIIKINYDSSKIEFWSKGAMKYPRGGLLLKPQIQPLPVHHFKIKDQRSINARFLVDLGAGLNMMLTTDFIRDSKLLHRKRKFFVKVAEGMGGKVDLNMTVIKEVRIGNFKFRNVPVFIFDDVYNVTSYPYLGGLIGNDLLRRFNIIINYDKQDMHLIPNKNYNDPFDYTYTGLELYYDQGNIIIGDVARGSPAEKAGLMDGDIVISINKNISQDMQRYKYELQTKGNRVKIIIRRGQELKDFEIVVKSIL